MEIVLPEGEDGDLQFYVVNIRKTNYKIQTMGKVNNNHTLDTQPYEVEFLDRTTKEIIEK